MNHNLELIGVYEFSWGESGPLRGLWIISILKFEEGIC